MRTLASGPASTALHGSCSSRCSPGSLTQRPRARPDCCSPCVRSPRATTTTGASLRRAARLALPCTACSFAAASPCPLAAARPHAAESASAAAQPSADAPPAPAPLSAADAARSPLRHHQRSRDQPRDSGRRVRLRPRRQSGGGGLVVRAGLDAIPVETAVPRRARVPQRAPPAAGKPTPVPLARQSPAHPSAAGKPSPVPLARQLAARFSRCCRRHRARGRRLTRLPRRPRLRLPVPPPAAAPAGSST